MDPAGGRYRWRSPQALACTLVCAGMLAGGRWGAHLGIPPVYLGDLLLAIAILHLAISRVLAGPRGTTGAAARIHPGLLLGVLLGWAIVRFALGSDHGFVAFRDLAPYAYAAVSFLAAGAYARSSPSDRSRTLMLIEIALLVHLAWMLPSRFIFGGGEVSNADRAVHLFLARPDADGTVLGITACLFLARYLRHAGLARLLVAMVSLALMLSMTARAAVLATLVGLGLTLWCYLFSTGPATRRDRRVLMVGVAPIAIILLAAVVPQTTAGSKLLASVAVVRPDSTIVAAGLGTQQARAAAWTLVQAYASAELGRQWVGVGFGPHFMSDSGASVALVGRDAQDLRSPHSYLLGTYARLGLVGLILLGLVIARMLSGMWSVLRIAGSDDLVLLAVIVPPMIMVEACFGVVLEAPFGAIPFFWFLGVLLAKPLQIEPNVGIPAGAPFPSRRTQR